MTKCNCDEPGYCATHRRMMCAVRHDECRNKPGYYEVFQKDLKNKALQNRGLGDTIKGFTDKSGLTEVANLFTKITGKDCGCSDRQKKLNDWWRDKQFVEVAVTTAPRPECTLHKSVASIIRNHWEPVIFAEPGSFLHGLKQLRIIQHEEKQGAWHNWLYSVRWMLENTKSDYILTVQDDTKFVEGIDKHFATQFRWPEEAGLVSLYTPAHYDKGSAGWHRVRTRNLWGACALMFPRDVLADLLETKTVKKWQGANTRSGKILNRKPHEIANVDTAIGRALNEMGKDMYWPTPSFCEHIARKSSIPGHGGNTGKRNSKRVVTDWSMFDPMTWYEQRINTSGHEYYEVARNLVHKYQPRGTLLDVGGGLHLGCTYLDGYEHDCTVIDTAKCDTIPTKKPVRYLMEDFYHWEPDQQYDVVLCLQCLEHHVDPRQFAHKLLRAGKTIVVSVPYRWKLDRGGEHHQHMITEEKMRQWFQHREPVESVIVGKAKKHRLIQVYQNN